MADPPALLSTGRILDLSLVRESFCSSDQDQADALAWVALCLVEAHWAAGLVGFMALRVWGFAACLRGVAQQPQG